MKTTEKGIDEAFFMSISELKFSEDNSENYYLCRVSGINGESDKMNFYKVKGCINKEFSLQPTEFKIYLKPKYK